MERLLERLVPPEAKIPLDDLAATPFPKLAVSDGWSLAFDAVRGVLERALKARRADLPEYGGHGAQHAPGSNERLEAFWRAAG